ncbi:MAG: protein phosphatase 2C domain-containing protein [Actinomycetota bacterium]
MATIDCPTCGEKTIADASFCEACGADLVAVEPVGGACVSCGAHAVDGDYCLECGHRQPDPHDHVEVRDGRVAGVTDVGHRHHRNEDAMALADLGDALVTVVCDGVSTTDNPHEASQGAADAFLAVVAAAVRSGAYAASTTLVDAVGAAQDAVLSVERPGSAGNPSCTLVAAVMWPERSTVDVCWLGDSRAYWLGPDEGAQLTNDHSWANEAVAAGEATLEEAERDPRAHTITRWLGADAVDLAPGIITADVGAGRLVACTDGLWNYEPEPDALAARVAEIEGDALAVAAALTDFALDAGGRDNITVVVTDAHVDTRSRP